VTRPLKPLSQSLLFRAGLAAFCLAANPGVLHAEGDPSVPPVTKASPYSATTLVIFNRSVPDSEALARYYAAARKIPVRNLLGVECSSEEEITRTQYRDTIAGPLRKGSSTKDGGCRSAPRRQGNRFCAASSTSLPSCTGCLCGSQTTAVAPERPPFESSGASVDSELATLGREGATHKGPIPNPYHRSEVAFHAADLPMQLVGRIDAPSLNRCRTMIDDAIVAETKGLWGQAYIDLDESQPLGNDWLRTAASAWRKLGIPVTVDIQPGTYPLNYPMRDPILYFGWHADQINGPFLNPAFKFQPGAVASHIHSLNAATVRSSTRNWAGPLLARGAAAVLGTVDDPGPHLSQDAGIFSDRLSRGFTLIESAYAATESLSWMYVAVGDPLYRPFPTPAEPIDTSQFAEDQWTPYKSSGSPTNAGEKRTAPGRWSLLQA